MRPPKASAHLLPVGRSLFQIHKKALMVSSERKTYVTER